MPNISLLYLIDDDPAALLLNEIIVQSNHQIQSFQSFENAETVVHQLQQLHRDQQPLPDLILVDLNMPYMNGFEFITAMEAALAPDHIPIVMLSSTIDPEEINKAIAFPSCVLFVSKPLDHEKLQQIINNWGDLYGGN
jgi:CheY-like chemotaxis protein